MDIDCVGRCADLEQLIYWLKQIAGFLSFFILGIWLGVLFGGRCRC